MPALDPATHSQREAIALLRKRLEAIAGTTPDDDRARLEGEARLFGGVYTPRNIRNTNIPSIHAWGTAIDFDPAGNPFEAGRDAAKLSTLFAQTMEEAGFLSHGLLLNRDWMHFELSREALTEIERGGYVPPTRACADKQ